MNETRSVTGLGEGRNDHVIRLGLTAVLTVVLLLLQTTTVLSMSVQLSALAVGLGGMLAVAHVILAGGFTNPVRTAPDRAEFVITVVATVVGLGLSLVLTSTQAGAVIHGGLAYLWVGSIATVVVGWQQREP